MSRNTEKGSNTDDDCSSKSSLVEKKNCLIESFRFSDDYASQICADIDGNIKDLKKQCLSLVTIPEDAIWKSCVIYDKECKSHNYFKTLAIARLNILTQIIIDNNQYRIDKRDFIKTTFEEYIDAKIYDYIHSNFIETDDQTTTREFNEYMRSAVLKWFKKYAGLPDETSNEEVETILEKTEEHMENVETETESKKQNLKKNCKDEAGNDINSIMCRAWRLKNWFMTLIPGRRSTATASSGGKKSRRNRKKRTRRKKLFNR